MRLFRSQFVRSLVVLVTLAVAGGVHAGAQALSSGAQVISLAATLTESISINVSANAVNFTLTPGSATNNGSTAVVATTTWNSKPGRNITTYIFFNTATAALADGSGNNIPSSAFQVSDNGGAFQALTNTVNFGGAGAGLALSSTKIIGTNKQSSQTDNLLFNIDLSTLPQLPAGSYTGTVTLRAEAI
jgi:hypothetical protein